ncbi:YggT family protein [Bacillus alkalicellulosilyticus]|uniref:YggT family protein n=1 Tax=Alkalihalobacterium alkalicellulosilyticum TaxID=1912214 RepID=UPI0009966731|nr:YggT family protein [Bacillus alkalicellulosilyticus]
MSGIGSLLYFALQIYSWMIIGYILMSWFPNARESSIGQFIGSLVEPFLAPFRKFIPPLGMIDISPIVAILTLHLARIGVTVLFS